MAMNRKGWIVIASIACAVVITRTSFAVADGDNVFNGMPHNGLASEAFRINALTTNKQALGILTDSHHRLRDALRDPYIARQLLDPNARAVLHEIIRCALPASETIDYANAAPASFSVRGELGLCRTSDPDLSSAECQEFVTACVAARVNALHKSIPISLRSVLAPLASPHSKVSTTKEFRESEPGSDPAQGIPVGSFDASCTPPGKCGWQAAYVGTCDPGTDVTLVINDAAACSSATLRVCAGIHGCFRPRSGYALPADFPPSGPTRYLEYGQEKHGVCTGAPLVFPCPSDEGVAGYFSTMVRLDAPGPSHEPYQAVAQRGGARAFPAPEADAFPFLEGAFYGNLFRPDQLKRSCEVTVDGTELTLTCVPGPARDRGDAASCSRPLAVLPRISAAGVPGADACLVKEPSLPYADIYACYSYAQQVENNDTDEAGAAPLNSRLCDLPGAGAHCFPHALRRCHYANGKGLCTAIEGKGGAYGECHGEDGDSATAYHRIVTTYLNEPCDVIGEGRECARLRATLSRTGPDGGQVPKVAPGARGCAGCATGDPAGAIWPVLVALVVRGRRRRRPHAPAASRP